MTFVVANQWPLPCQVSVTGYMCLSSSGLILDYENTNKFLFTLLIRELYVENFILSEWTEHIYWSTSDHHDGRDYLLHGVTDNATTAAAVGITTRIQEWSALITLGPPAIWRHWGAKKAAQIRAVYVYNMSTVLSIAQWQLNPLDRFVVIIVGLNSIMV